MIDMRQKRWSLNNRILWFGDASHHLPEATKKYAQPVAVCLQCTRENSIMSHWSKWLKVPKNKGVK